MNSLILSELLDIVKSKSEPNEDSVIKQGALSQNDVLIFESNTEVDILCNNFGEFDTE